MPAASDPPVVPIDGTLIIAGFLGRGNAGDEAMLQVFFQEFSPRFNIVISVDQAGAHPGYWNWFPYTHAQIVHQNDGHAILRIPDTIGMLVGGGALPIGFAAGQLLVAKTRGIPAALAGVDAWKPPVKYLSPGRAALGVWLGLFDEIIPRTRISVDTLTSLGIESSYGADFALRLVTDGAPDIVSHDRRVLVVLREGLPGMAAEDFAAWVVNLMTQLEAAGYRPVLLPFSPEDDRLLTELDVCDRFAVERAWWNPRRLKQFMASSVLTVTVGRLHPMIFAAPTGQSVAVLRPPQWSGKRAGLMSKLTDMAQELGIDVFDTTEDFITMLKDGRVRPAEPSRVQAALDRVDVALASLHRLFRRDAVSQAGVKSRAA
jgi:polysaccharide pyruvyl transferase WcaK-like protein